MAYGLQKRIGRRSLLPCRDSLFLLLPWLLLIRALRRGVSDTGARLTYILLFLGWLTGPIVIWGQHVAKIDILASLILEGPGDSQPEHPILAYGVFAAMAIMWMGSAVVVLLTLQALSDPLQSREQTLR